MRGAYPLDADLRVSKPGNAPCPRTNFAPHPEVLGAKRRASKGDGPSASTVYPSRLASPSPQDDGIGASSGPFYQGTKGLPARAYLVLRFGLEIAGVVALV
jgi:hypothetical protein